MAKGEPFTRDEHQTTQLVENAAGKSSRVSKPLEDDKERPLDQKAATYRIGQDLIERINEASERLGVEKTSFIKALLTHALDELDAENWELPPAGKRKLKI